jgi:hypothetical protein
MLSTDDEFRPPPRPRPVVVPMPVPHERWGRAFAPVIAALGWIGLGFALGYAALRVLHGGAP